MVRKLMLSLMAAAALAGCTPILNQDVCADVGYWDGDGNYVTEPTSNPACQGLVDVPLPDESGT